MAAVKFKSPTTTQITVRGRTYTAGEITPEVYSKLVQLSPSLADKFIIEEEEEAIQNITANGNSEEKQSSRRRRQADTEGQ